MDYITNKTESGILRHDIFVNDFKSVRISLDFFVPITKESASYISLLCAVLKRGNAVHGEMDKVGEFLDENYGATIGISSSKKGDLQCFSLKASVIDDRFTLDNEPVLENIVSFLYATLFCPILEDGGFKVAFVEQEKQNLKDYIAALINDKRQYSLEKAKQIMFKNDAYGVYEHGDAQTVDSITAKSLYEFMNSLLYNSMLYVGYAGAKRDVDAILKPIMKKLDVGTRPVFCTAVDNSVDTVKYEVEPMNVKQSKLNIGFRLGEGALRDPFAARLFNVIYGASPTSKLFNNVRERLSLCYYCASAADMLKNIMFVYSGIETENYEKARDEIFAQLELMKKGEFTDEEFSNAMAGLVDSYVQMGDSLSSLLSGNVAYHLASTPMTRDEMIAKIKEVTPERVVAVAKDVAVDTVYLLKGTGGADDAE